MSTLMIKAKNGRLPLADLVALVAILLIMAASWFMINGVATAVYQQYDVNGQPPRLMGPVGSTEKSQMGNYDYFWSERAFHYRTTLMFALNDYDDVATLQNDKLQQHPDGVNSWDEYTLLMEPVYAQLYRWFGIKGELLVEFLLRLIPLVHVLLFIPLYFLARNLGVRTWLAVAGVLVYATCTMGFARMSGALLLKENFALLWLMIFLAAHQRAVIKKDFIALVLAALAMILALASWHLSQFLLLVVFLAAGLSCFWNNSKLNDSNTDELSNSLGWGVGQGAWWPPAVYLLAGILAGLTPSLLNRGFFISLPMAALVAWLVSAWWGERSAVKSSSSISHLLFWISPLMAFGLLAVFNPFVHGDYNHVTGLLFQKILHGFVRPEDPTSLPFDVRVFWAPPFTSPAISEIILKLGFHVYLVLAALGWFVLSVIRRQIPRHLRAFLITALGYLLAWLMIERLGVIFWPLAAVAVVLSAEQLLTGGQWRGRGNPVLVVGFLLLLTPALNMGGILKPQIEMARKIHNDQRVKLGVIGIDKSSFKIEMLDWLRRETPGPGSSFSRNTAGGVLGDIGVLPQVLLYARRPIVLNSQFENSVIRQRYQMYLELLFGDDEEQFASFLEKTDTDYVFIDRNLALNTGPGTVAWQAGVSENLSSNLVITRMHFRPESFSFLKPVFDNEYYRVFHVTGRGQKHSIPSTWLGKQGKWWNEEYFTFDHGELVDLPNDLKNMVDSENQWIVLQTQMQSILTPLQGQASVSNPPLMALHQQRLQLYFNKYTGQGEARASELIQLEKLISDGLNRQHPSMKKSVFQLLQPVWLGTSVDPGMKNLLAKAPADPVNYASAGQLLGMLDQYEMAADQLLKAASYFPLQPMQSSRGGKPLAMASSMASRLRQECVWWNIGAQRFDLASELASDFLPFESPGSRQAKFYQALIEAGHK